MELHGGPTTVNEHPTGKDVYQGQHTFQQILITERIGLYRAKGCNHESEVTMEDR